MRGWITAIVLIVSLGFGAGTSAASELTTRDFFANSLVTDMKISPDGEHVAFTYEEESEVKLAVMELEDQSITAGFSFGENQHVLDFWWGSDERVLMSVGEVTGYLDNLGRPATLYAADVDGSDRKQIFQMVTSSYRILHTLPEDPDYVLIVRYHWADGGEPSANLLNIHDGDLRNVTGQPLSNNLTGLLADNSGRIRAATESIAGETFDESEFALYVRHGEDWRRLPIEAKRQPVDVRLIGFSGDNRKAYFLSNHDLESNDRLGVFVYDFDRHEVELLYRHPEVDISGVIRGYDGDILGVATRFGPAEYTFFEDKIRTNENAVLLQRLALSFPGQNVGITSFTTDGGKAIVQVSGDRNPGEYYLFDTQTLQARYLSASNPDLPKSALVPMEPVEIEARDGLVLHAMLTRPEDQKENLPLIVNVHGGPFGITDRWGFNQEAQYFAHHGYATLQVNFRGSGNRGTDFINKGRREWGGKMQDDVTDATRWAIDQGIADPERICIYGGSYGGYASLMGVIREPDLYQCAVGYVGVYDLPWFREGDGNDMARQTASSIRQARERWFSAHVGDDPEKLRAASPVHNVDRIKAELFIVHGGSDVRVVVGHAERLRAALDAIGKSYRWMLKEGEGHGFYRMDNRVDLYESMLDFFDQHIGSNGAGAN
ncbi:MAG: S9 family peptidase [Wenzhouxiangella sp.]|jgi:dipeptidyl aminopeptidase/acylaminoacyl peptidase|nr:S9 family peptidase [Wenzhouxiangella sp.]